MSRLRCRLERRQPLFEVLVLGTRARGHLLHSLELLTRDEILALEESLDQRPDLLVQLGLETTEGAHGTGRGTGEIVEQTVLRLHDGRTIATGTPCCKRSTAAPIRLAMSGIIVVTGGAGFIGSNILAGLEARGGDALVCCDLFGDGDKWKNVAKRSLFDVVAPNRLADWLAGPAGARVTAIVHMGAISDTTARDVDKILDQNFAFTRMLWSWCSAHQTRFIYASSAATYGDGTMGFDDDSSLSGLARLRPMNPYGWSKHLFDRFAAQALATGLARPPQHVGLKFFNVYGPNEYHKGGQRSVVHQIHPIAARGEPFALFKSHRAGIGDGQQLRDFVWVGDCVDVVLWLLDTPRVSGLFNIGSGKARSFLDLATAVYAACGRNANIVFRDMPAELRDRYQYFTEAKLERLRAAGYARPFTTIETGVERYVRDYLAAEDAFA